MFRLMYKQKDVSVESRVRSKNFHTNYFETQISADYGCLYVGRNTPHITVTSLAMTDDLIPSALYHARQQGSTESLPLQRQTSDSHQTPNNVTQ
jgi:hypothetical protein